MVNEAMQIMPELDTYQKTLGELLRCIISSSPGLVFVLAFSAVVDDLRTFGKIFQFAYYRNSAPNKRSCPSHTISLWGIY